MGEARQTKEKVSKATSKAVKDITTGLSDPKNAALAMTGGVGLGLPTSIGISGVTGSKINKGIADLAAEAARKIQAEKNFKNKAVSDLGSSVDKMYSGNTNLLTGKKLTLLQGRKDDKTQRILDIFNSRQQDIERRSLLTTTR